MLLTRRKRKLDEMEKDDELKKYEEKKLEINKMSNEIMKLKQQIDEFKEVDQLNLKMALLYQRGIVDNEGNHFRCFPEHAANSSIRIFKKLLHIFCFPCLDS